MTPAAYPTLAARTPRGKPYIICVDDVVQVVDALEEQLYGRLGRAFHLEKATSGEEALDLVEQLLASGKNIAAIVADVQMPGMTGDELLIRVHQLSPRTRTIMLTGQQGTTSQITNAINQANLYRFIAKPWEMADMQLTVEEAGRSYLADLQLEEQNQTLRLLHEAAQLLARQRNLADLAPALLRQALQYSGAERAALVSVVGLKEPQVLARVAPGHGVTQEALSLAEAGGELVVGIVEEALAGQHVLVDDVPTSRYATHGYVARHAPCSLLAMPLLNQGRVVGVLYLEHRTQAQVFTPASIDILNILTAQAAIALDHAYLTQHLEAIVLERTQALMAVSSHKDEMVRIVSHDIRSPLTGIFSLAGLLREPDIAGNAREVARYGELLQRSTTTVLKLVNDILDLARLESGTILLSRSPVNLAQVLRATAELFEPLLLTKQQHLRLHIADEHLVLDVDEAKVQQALQNLVSNAVKFTPKSGQIDVRLLATPSEAILEVADAGVGIPEEELPRLFEKFGARQRMGTAGERGTGLGLSITRELIHLHQGRLEVQSVLGRGTTFRIHLPRLTNLPAQA